ncbi:XRE family transcriptional regulator [Priestia megaterium]|uniref:XRE family transcriptional regulator n=1 Tax=Priestia megaterium TaxID=1404 RepID=UPI003C303B54
MSGSRKKRSKLGKFLDRHKIDQEWLVRQSGLGRNTIGDLANSNDRSPTTRTIQKIMKVIRKIDPNAKADDFFDI